MADNKRLIEVQSKFISEESKAPVTAFGVKR